MPKGIVNATAKVLSTPARAKSALTQNRANKAARILKGARKFKGMPDMDVDGNFTEGFRARSVADGVKSKFKRK